MSSQNEQIETVTFQALAHPTRRTIIRIIQSRSQGISYTELISELGLPTGKLNYHLEQLRGLIEKDNAHRYVLTSFGQKAVEHLNLIEQKVSVDDEKYVKAAVTTQKASLQPMVKMFIYLGIAAVALLISVWAYIGYIAIMEGAPAIVYVLLPALIAIGFCLLGLLVYAAFRSPSWIKRLERRYFEG